MKLEPKRLDSRVLRIGEVKALDPSDARRPAPLTKELPTPGFDGKLDLDTPPGGVPMQGAPAVAEVRVHSLRDSADSQRAHHSGQ